MYKDGGQFDGTKHVCSAISVYGMSVRYKIAFLEQNGIMKVMIVCRYEEKKTLASESDIPLHWKNTTKSI